jgi:phosphosulfolactate synthase (CoM biosynthesis protein A)/extradiol dioxygenase family protein
MTPGQHGITMVIDTGLPTGAFTDLIESHGELIDLVKFGWGTALVTRDIDRKTGALKDAGIGFYFGGTLFEHFVWTGELACYLELVERFGATHIEVSNGTIPLDQGGKADYVRRLAGVRPILSEVGYKDADRSALLTPSDWVDALAQDLDAGASMVITEARESGRSGIARADGHMRTDPAGHRPHRGDVRGADQGPAGRDDPHRRPGGQPGERRRRGRDRRGDPAPRAARRHPAGPDHRYRPRPAAPVPPRPAGRLTAHRRKRPMRDTHDACHIAIPVRDLDEAMDFYVFGLGAKLARRYADRITLDFFGDQLVCHLCADVPAEPIAYPSHFGVSFARAEDFDRLTRLVEQRKLRVLSGPALRFEGTAEQHRTIFLADPSNNVIEFKNYDDPRLQY